MFSRISEGEFGSLWRLGRHTSRARQCGVAGRTPSARLSRTFVPRTDVLATQRACPVRHDVCRL